MCQALDYEDETSFHPQGAHGLMGEEDAAVNTGEFGCLALEPPFYWGETQDAWGTGPCPCGSRVEAALWQLACSRETWARLV